MKIIPPILAISSLAIFGAWASLSLSMVHQNRSLRPAVFTDNPALEMKKEKVFFKGEPFSGILVKHYKNGAVESQTQYHKGLKSGAQLIWYPEGEPQSIRYYENNRKEGLHLGFWPNGNHKFEYTFRKGLLEGISQDWYESGKPFMRRNFFKGKELGSQKAWGPEGQLYSNYVVKGGNRYGLVGSKPCFTVGH